jgi:hypothetical protein
MDEDVGMSDSGDSSGRGRRGRQARLGPMGERVSLRPLFAPFDCSFRSEDGGRCMAQHSVPLQLRL